ncbi:MAG: tyrosine-type recombinase/integrase [Syntrophobacteraceae bacterium]|nr:tyrosine-type recombinase/integrase [Syntrophobacteraceae bacterium]
MDWANQFLDAQRLRGLSLHSLRTYAFNLLSLARWFATASVELCDLTPVRLSDYIRFQLNQQPRPSAQTVNQRLSVANAVYRFHYGDDATQDHGPNNYTRPLPFSYSWRWRAVNRLRIKMPRKVVIPLTSQEVADFWSSFRTFRDVALVALMLFGGLRSLEVLGLKLEDLLWTQGQIVVRGKGNRQRLLPVDPQIIEILKRYLSMERPPTDSAFVFVVLKGPNRGKPLTAAGLRTLFRHHRRLTQIAKANPHRFRHTFGADMVRAGISLPALMKLMGHAHIKTTMLYVQLSAQDVWREFHRAIKNRERPPFPEVP